MNCECAKYEDIELLRENVTRRIQQAKKIKLSLTALHHDPKTEHSLWVCSTCNQYWQGSYAWNWEQKFYLFKVPLRPLVDWLQEPFVQPDELLIFYACVGNIWDKAVIDIPPRSCRREGCEKKAIKYSVLCLLHHIESLQKNRLLPAYPDGRW